jgi:hypothetical protein
MKDTAMNSVDAFARRTCTRLTLLHRQVSTSDRPGPIRSDPLRMSTQRQPTTDRIATDQPRSDARWRDETRPVSTETPTRHAQYQFSPGIRQRLYNLIDDENRAMLD